MRWMRFGKKIFCSLVIFKMLKWTYFKTRDYYLSQIQVLEKAISEMRKTKESSPATATTTSSISTTGSCYWDIENIEMSIHLNKLVICKSIFRQNICRQKDLALVKNARKFEFVKNFGPLVCMSYPKAHHSNF